MNVSSHLGMILLVIVGVVTIFGVVVIAAVETRRMDKGKPSLISRKKSGETEGES